MRPIGVHKKVKNQGSIVREQGSIVREQGSTVREQCSTVHEQCTLFPKAKCVPKKKKKRAKCQT